MHVFTTNVDGPTVSDVRLGEPVSLDGVSVTYFPTGIGRRLYRSPAMYEALSRSLPDFDVIHLHSVFLWPTTAAAGLARRLGLPYVLSPRGMLVPELIRRRSRLLKHAWIGLFERRNVAEAAAIHATTEAERADIRRLGLSVRQFAVIPNGIQRPSATDCNDGSAARSIPSPRILFLGRINWKKGLDRLIRALALVPDAQLVIAGNDEENYTRQLISLSEREGVVERTHFLGPLHGIAKWRAIADADVFVLPSYSENFGIAVLEAMASGVPVIVTPEVGLAKAVSDAKAGLVVDGTPERIGAAIAQLVASPALRSRMGEAGREAAIRDYSWDSIAEQMEAVYVKVARNGKHGCAPCTSTFAQ